MVDPMAVKGVSDSRPVTRVAPVAAPTRTAPVAPSARDTASLNTTDVATLSGVAAQLASKPPVDTERVAQIKHAIANGTFPISPATIADRLLALRYDWIARDQA